MNILFKRKGYRLWGLVVWEHSLTQAYKGFPGKSQKEGDLSDHDAYLTKSDPQGTLGERTFGQRSIVLGGMTRPLCQDPAELLMGPP